MSYREFIRLQVTHAYRGGLCPDIAFVLPADTQRTLGRARMLVRRSPGTLTLPLELGSSGDARVTLDAARLRVGIRVANPHFQNFTALAWDPRQLVRVYASAAAPDTLSAPIDALLLGSTPAFSIAGALRPVSVELRDRDDVVIWTETLTDARTELSCDLRTIAPGRYTLAQTDANGTTSTHVYLDPELRAAGCIAIVELELSALVYARDNSWSLAFDARSEPLRYWVLAKGLTNNELNKLAVSDEGHAEDGRSEITFDKLLPASFSAADLATAARIASGQDVILFRSALPIARSQTPLRKLQLGRNGDVVVPNLPLPGPERATSEMIIHLTKP